MATGPNHSVVLLQSDNSQVLMGCGSNEAGQLGNYFDKFSQLEQIEQELDGALVSKVGCGVSFTGLIVTHHFTNGNKLVRQEELWIVGQMPYYNIVEETLKLPLPPCGAQNLICSDGAILIHLRDGTMLQYGAGYQMAKVPFGERILQIAASSSRFGFIDNTGVTVWNEDNFESVFKMEADGLKNLTIGDDFGLVIDS